MKNLEIREAAKSAGIHLWQIAEQYGCTDGTFSRKLRKEFSPEEKKRILCIIDKLRMEAEA